MLWQSSYAEFSKFLGHFALPGRLIEKELIPYLRVIDLDSVVYPDRTSIHGDTKFFTASETAPDVVYLVAILVINELTAHMFPGMFGAGRWVILIRNFMVTS